MAKMTAAVKKAQNDRAKLEADLITAQMELLDCCQESPGKRQVQRRLNALDTVWNSLKDAHVTYCSAAGQEMSAVESQTYLREKQKIYSSAFMKAEAILFADEDEELGPDKAQLGLELKGDISLLQLDIQEKIKSLYKIVAAPSISSEAHKDAMKILQNLEEKLRQEYKDLTGKLGQYLDTDAVNAEREKAQKFMEENIPKLGDLQTKMVLKIPVKAEVNPVRQGTEAAAAREETKPKQRIKTAPIPVPKWDGKSRTFPRFKKMWEENIIPYHEPSALHMMLVQALPEEVLDEISSLASSYQVIWDHLEDKAGKAEVVARDIMGELLSLSDRK